MRTRGILMAFPGYPITVKSLIPHHRLALIAGALIDAGHSPRILDYGCVDTVRRLFSHEHRGLAHSLSETLLSGLSSISFATFSTLWRLRDLDRALTRRHEKRCQDVARDIAGTKGLDYVIFSIDRVQDLKGILMVAGDLRRMVPWVRLAATGRVVEYYGIELAGLTGVFDCLCLRDPETWLVRWADVIDRPSVWSSIPNLALSTHGVTTVTEGRRLANAGERVAPQYSPTVYPALAGNEKIKVFRIECGWGCSQTCNRCNRSETQGNEVHMRTPRAICDEMARLSRQHGTCVFELSGLALEPHAAVSVAHEILARGMTVAYSQTGTVNTANPATFPILRASGNRVVSFDVGTGSQWLLDDYFAHDFGVTKTEHILRASKSAGLFTIARFLYPCPADDYHSHAETLRLIERTRPDAALIDLPDAVPGSEWSKRAEGFGFDIDVPRYLREGILRGHRSSMPKSWRRTHYRGATRSGGAARRLQESLARDIEALGISTLVTPQIALVAQISGCYAHEHQYGILLRRQLMTGDAVAVGAAAQRFNECAAALGKSAMYGARVPALAAVGN